MDYDGGSLLSGASRLYVTGMTGNHRDANPNSKPLYGDIIVCIFYLRQYFLSYQAMPPFG